MADQHNDNIPAVGNSIAADIPDIKENLEFHKDCLEAITGGWSNTSTANVVVGNKGLFTRARFVWKDADEIYIDPGVYHLAGSTDQMVYWDSQLTFQLGSGGSNAASEDPGSQTEWHYIYLDDSAIGATNLLTAAKFLNCDDAPSYSVGKHGWYGTGADVAQTTDRCVFAVRLVSGSVLEFYHDGGDYVEYLDDFADLNNQAISATPSWTTVTHTIPAFATKALCGFHWVYSNAGAYVYYRVYGSNGTGHFITHVNSVTTLADAGSIVLTDSSQRTQVNENTSSSNTLTVNTRGFFFPRGM